MRKILRKTNRPKELDITNRILVEPEDYDLMPDLCFDPSPFIAAGISAASSVGSAAINAGSKWGSSTYMRVAKEMANYNTRLNEQQYERWQSPSALMRQYKEAGLNPNLVYQAAAGAASGGVPAGQVSTNPNDYASDRTRWAEALNGVANAATVYQDVLQRNANLNNTQAVTETVAADRLLKLAETEGRNIQNEYQSKAMSYQIEGLANKVAQESLDLELDRQFKAQERRAGLLKTREEIANTSMDTTKKSKEIAKIDGEIGSIDQSITESKYRCWSIEKNIELGLGNLQVARQNANTQSSMFNLQSEKWNAVKDEVKHANDYQQFRRTGQFPEDINFWGKATYLLNNLLDRIPFVPTLNIGTRTFNEK